MIIADIIDERILVSLMQELTWTHFLALLPLKDALARERMPVEQGLGHQAASEVPE
jgi:hypothetical protein